MKVLSPEELKAVIGKLNDIVQEAGAGSALEGLTCVAVAFACLLDVYAAPNPNNPEGMCDDKVAFRKYFADIIDEGVAR